MTDDRERWEELALCQQADPEVFFPVYQGDGSAIRAKAICRMCPVRRQCLDYALEHREHYGVWGGTTSGERDRLLRARMRESA